MSQKYLILKSIECLDWPNINNSDSMTFIKKSFKKIPGSVPTPKSRSKIAIIGCGITGLSLAHRLNNLIPESKITMFDKSSRVGGLLNNDILKGSIDGSPYMFQVGPKSFLKHGGEETLKLMKSLGIENEIIDACSTKRFIYSGTFDEVRNGKLINRFGRDFLLNTLKHLLRGNPFYYKRNHKMDCRDISVKNFIKSLLGEDLSLYVEPSLLGIYAGDYERLSMKSCFPQLWEYAVQNRAPILMKLIESMKGNITNFAKPANEIPKSTSFSLKNGTGQLCDALYNQLKRAGVEFKLNTSIDKIAFDKRLFSIDGEQEGNAPFDILVSCVSSPTLTSILKKSLKINSPEKQEILTVMTREISSIQQSPIATTKIAYKGRPKITSSLKSFGFLIPSVLKCPILGITFDSEVFPQHNLNEDETRMTVMSGGFLNKENEIFTSLSNSNNVKIRQWGQNQLETKIKNFLKKELFNGVLPKLDVFKTELRRIPQYTLGHEIKMERMKNHLKNLKNFYVTGWSFNGVSINKCIENSFRVAEEISKDYK